MNRDDCKFLTLPSGGRIAYSEYGVPSGRPVFFFHGWPSSRTMGELTDAPARELGLRIISPDRPGICGSTFQPNRTLRDWPDVLEQLANHLAFDRFHVAAFSGGAPYAFVTAWQMPHRVRAIAVVSSAVPIAELSEYGGLLPLYRWMIWFHIHHPRLLKFLFYAARPIVSLRTAVRVAQRLLRMLPPADAAALRDRAAFEICFESQRKAWQGSADGVVADARIYGQPWGFRLEEINIPVRLWHGTQDRAFSVRLAKEMAKKLPNCAAHFIENEGHYSTPIRHMREILADLISL